MNLRGGDGAGNYAVESTINPKLQQLAQEQLKRFLEGPAAAAGLTQGALISLNTETGDILAYVGGGDYSRSSFDRVQALRQPGSTFKLFTFLAALAAGVSPTESISCAPLDYVGGCRQSDGSISVAAGLAGSENVVALRLAERAGFSGAQARATAGHFDAAGRGLQHHAGRPGDLSLRDGPGLCRGRERGEIGARARGQPHL